MRLLRSCEPQKHLLEDFCSGDDSTFDLVQLPRLWCCKAPLGEDTLVGPVNHHPAHMPPRQHQKDL